MPGDAQGTLNSTRRGGCDDEVMTKHVALAVLAAMSAVVLVDDSAWGVADTPIEGELVDWVVVGPSGYGNASALTPDGALIVAGSTSGENPSTFLGVGPDDVMLVKYRPNGSLDSDFGQAGVATTAIGENRIDSASAIALQPDGKILIAGSTQDRASPIDSDIVLGRYETDGRLDATFGDNGIVTTDLDDGSDVANAIALDADGRILIAGSTQDYHSAGDSEALVARYEPSGALDTTFGTNGFVTTEFGPGLTLARRPLRTNRFNAITSSPDGKIVAAGAYAFQYESPTEGSTIVSDAAVVRYQPDGSLDGTFGTAGIATVFPAVGRDTDWGFFPPEASARALLLDPSAAPLVVLERWDFDPTTNVQLVILGVDGDVPAFAHSSLYEKPVTRYHFHPRDAVRQPDGKIVVAGHSVWDISYWDLLGGCENGGGCSDFFLTRYNVDGTRDLTFGTDGYVFTNKIGTERPQATSIQLLPDGRIIAAGSASPVNRGEQSSLAVVRYHPDGTLDQRVVPATTTTNATVPTSTTAPSGAAAPSSSPPTPVSVPVTLPSTGAPRPAAHSLLAFLLLITGIATATFARRRA